MAGFFKTRKEMMRESRGGKISLNIAAWPELPEGIDPFYQDSNVILFNCDCLSNIGLWNIDNAVMVSDPPYGMKFQSHMRKDGPSDAIAGDESPELRDKILEAWGDIKPALVFGTWRVPRPTACKQLLIWNKTGVGPLMGNLDLPWGPCHEDVYVLGSGFVGKRVSNVLTFDGLTPGSKDRPNHPTPKPVSLMKDLISHCPPSLIVVDPFAGSGTTLVAAKALGRKAIGIELETKYCEVIVERLLKEA